MHFQSTKSNIAFLIILVLLTTEVIFYPPPKKLKYSLFLYKILCVPIHKANKNFEVLHDKQSRKNILSQHSIDSSQILMTNYPLEKGLWNAHSIKKLNKQTPDDSSDEIDFLKTGALMSTTSALLQIQLCNSEPCSFLGKSTVHQPSSTLTESETDALDHIDY